jgi:hypothetical protein
MPNIDFAGVALLFLIVGPLMYVSSMGPRLGWGSGWILGAFVLLAAALVLFILREKRIQSPVIDVSLFRNPVFAGTMLCTFLMTWYQSSMRVYVPMVIQQVMGRPAAVSGSVLLPRSILNVVFPTLCGAWIAKDPAKRCWKGLLFTGALIAAGNLMFSFVSPGMALWMFFIGLGVTGVAGRAVPETAEDDAVLEELRDFDPAARGVALAMRQLYKNPEENLFSPRKKYPTINDRDFLNTLDGISLTDDDLKV